MADDADLAGPLIDREAEYGIIAHREELSGPLNVSGRCEDCDALISKERLRIKPNAKRCIGCQEVYEFHKKRGY